MNALSGGDPMPNSTQIKRDRAGSVVFLAPRTGTVTLTIHRINSPVGVGAAEFDRRVLEGSRRRRVLAECLEAEEVLAGRQVQPEHRVAPLGEEAAESTAQQAAAEQPARREREVAQEVQPFQAREAEQGRHRHQQEQEQKQPEVQEELAH